MENLGGALGFRATLNIDDFNVSAQSMERQIRNFSNTAISEVGEVEDSFRKMAESAGRYISYYLVGQGMHGLVNSIIQTRGQFQQLEIAFETMLGSTDKATTLMQQMVDTAAKTPFDLMGVAEGAKQLMAYGVSADKVNDTLVRLGNIASGLSIPLNDIVYLYGTTMVQGRLYAQDVRQFTGRGIPLVKELAEKYHTTADAINEMVSAGKIGFADVEEVLNKMTNSGGQFYNLMEKQSTSLTGQIANLQDAWDTVLNDWGKSNEGLFSGAIAGATYLVEHMDTLVRILKAVAIGYGSVKAAIVLNSVATKGYTGIAVIDNTVRSAKLVLMKAEAALNGTALAQKKAMTAAENAHFTALEATLSAEQQAAIVKQLRIGAITSLLTVQQQEYLSNIGLTTSSAGYEAAALSVLSAEQRLALSKMDLTAKSAAYRAAVIQEVQSKRASQAASLETMRTTVKEATVAVEAAKSKAISATQAVEAARYEVYWAQQSGNATAIAAAQKRLEAAVDQQAITHKAVLAAQSDFYAKKKQFETLATTQGRAASVADTAAKTAQTAATNILSAATGKLSTMFKALWATLRANPFGWLLTIIGAVWSLITMFSNDTEKTTDVMEEFSEGTKKVTDKLDLYFAILSKAEKNGKTYRDMIAKINEICQEYNATLLDENATLKEQEARYLEVKAAVQATTAEKIKAKRIEEELNKLNEKGDTNYDSFETRLNNLQYRTGKTKTINDKKHGESYEVEIQEAAENIQNAAPEVREAIRSLVESGAQELAKLSGSEYTQKYNEIIAQIVAGTKAGTGATEREMQSFEAQLRLYLDNQIRDVQVYDKAIALVDERLNNFLAPKDTSATEGITDYAQMSFEDLDNLVTQTQKDIDAINNSTVGPGADTTGLDTLLSKLAEIKGAIQTKTDNLNTEQGISDRIKQLKQERAETEINSTRYKELNKEISKLEGKMPKHTTGGGGGANNAARNAETLRQKQVDAERRVEEARIAVMEEGYDKRKALLDLQHKQNLAQIEREEKELIEARKKAGKGGLSDTEKQGFEQRRTYENQSYTQSQNKLFEGELDYKRKQYELYWRWVENMGKDVADKQFASLLQSGGSYKEYIEKQIAELQGKKQAGVLTEGEGNFLISLNVQYDELTGARTALEAFKQAVSETIGRSQTLAEKLEAVADAKRKLENGESGIVNDDDRAAMSLELSKQEADLQKQVHETVLNDYRTFEEQRKSITEEYALLRAEAERMGDEERIKLINKAETEALSALNTGFLLQTDSWKKLFSDLDTLSVGQIQKLVSDIDKQLAAGTLKLSPVDYKAVIESLNQAKQRIQELNPFAALDTFFNDYLKAKQKLAKAKAALAKGEGSKEDVESAEREVKSAANGITQSVEKVTDITTDCASSLQSMFDALGMDGVSDGIGTAIELMGELGNAAASVGQFMAGDVVGGITGMISSITSVIGIFAKMHDAKYEKKIQNLQKQIDALERSYSRLERAFNNTYWVFNDEERAGFERNIQLIEDQIAALEQQRQTARRAWDFAQYAQLTAQIKDLNQQLSKAKEGDDMLGLYEQQKASLREQQELMKQQIQAERDKKKTDNDKIQQWNDAIEQIEQQIEDLDRQMMETFAGTTTKEALDQYADAIVDAYCAGEDAAKALGDTTREVLKKAVVDALKRNFLAKAMDDAIQYLGEAMSDGELTAREKSKFEALVNAAGATFTNALEAVGDWIKDIDDEATSSDPLTGAVTSMSEETGGVIAGRLNAFIINQTDQTSVMRQQLLQQSAIVQNTATANVILAEVRDTLKRIETKDNSLLSQGIS
ncbi:phage tail tape measure protein [Muribaculaceae bacterium Z1]|nr:phage tail tape measure protein [Muribaculaceae bacterium S4]NBI19445.1 phage tail tape measure protein [Muribaculaceae bacterium Z1]